MCFDIKSQLLAHYKRAKHWDSEKEAIFDKLKEIIRELEIKDYHHVSAFEQPRLPIFTLPNSIEAKAATWGYSSYNRNHYNARSESIFQLETFEESANLRRCVVYVNGFFEHYHYRKKTYPYFIQREDEEPFAIAALYNEHESPNGIVLNTFTILTIVANPMMAKIHNNPKLAEPRMPVILPEENVDKWLTANVEENELKELLLPFPEEVLKSHTVKRIHGKNAIGNIPEATKEHQYQELEEKDQSLF